MHDLLLALADVDPTIPGSSNVRAAATALLNMLPTHTPTRANLQAALHAQHPAEALTAILDEAAWGAGGPPSAPDPAGAPAGPLRVARVMYTLQCLTALLSPCQPPRLAVASPHVEPAQLVLSFFACGAPRALLRRTAAMAHALHEQGALSLLPMAEAVLSLVSGMLQQLQNLLWWLCHGLAAQQQQQQQAGGQEVQVVHVLDDEGGGVEEVVHQQGGVDQGVDRGVGTGSVDGTDAIPTHDNDNDNDDVMPVDPPQQHDPAPSQTPTQQPQQHPPTSVIHPLLMQALNAGKSIRHELLWVLLDLACLLGACVSKVCWLCVDCTCVLSVSVCFYCVCVYYVD